MIREKHPAHFGTNGKHAGHRLFASGREPDVIGVPANDWRYKFDGSLAPRTSLEQGAGALHYIHGYWVLAFHDYTVDGRLGSNSVFWIPQQMILPGVPCEQTPSEAWEPVLAKARELWPWVFERPLGIFQE